MADQFTGRNLLVTIDGDTVTCPQSFEISSQHEFVEYYCTGADAKQRIYDGTDWTGSCTFLPEDNDHAEIADYDNSTAVAVVCYPDGNTTGKIMITFNAFTSVALSTARGSAASVTVNFVVDGGVTIDDAP